MKLQFLIFISLLFFISGINAQNLELLSGGGGNVNGNNLSGSFSIGEPMIATYINQNYRLTQGFHQSNEFTTSTREPQMDLLIDVYPNPFSSEIFIRPAETQQVAFVKIESIHGKVQYFQKVDQVLSNGSYRIDTTPIGPGVSILQILDEHKRLLHSFTLVKI